MCPIFVLWNFVAAFTIVIPSIIKQKCMIPQIYILDPTGLINDPQNMLSLTLDLKVFCSFLNEYQM